MEEARQAEWWLKLTTFCDGVTEREKCDLRHFLLFYNEIPAEKYKIAEEALKNERNRLK